MRTAMIVCLCFTLLVAVSEANFYGKRAMEGKTLKDLIQDMRLQKLGGADAVLDQIALLIKEYRTARDQVIRDSAIEN